MRQLRLWLSQCFSNLNMYMSHQGSCYHAGSDPGGPSRDQGTPRKCSLSLNTLPPVLPFCSHPTSSIFCTGPLTLPTHVPRTFWSFKWLIWHFSTISGLWLKISTSFHGPQTGWLPFSTLPHDLYGWLLMAKCQGYAHSLHFHLSAATLLLSTSPPAMAFSLWSL